MFTPRKQFWPRLIVDTKEKIGKCSAVGQMKFSFPRDAFVALLLGSMVHRIQYPSYQYPYLPTRNHYEYLNFYRNLAILHDL